MVLREEGTRTAPRTKDSPKTRPQPITDMGAMVVASAELGKKRALQRKGDAEKPL